MEELSVRELQAVAGGLSDCDLAITVSLLGCAASYESMARTCTS